LLIVDDAQWLDPSSWEALAFIGRRLESEPLLLLAGVREGELARTRLTRAGLPELRIEPLSHEDAAAMLQHLAPDLRPDLRSRVLAESAGNPLGLVELASVAVRQGERGLPPGSLPLPTRLERAYRAMLDDLPAPTRNLLTLAAFNDGDSLDEVLRAGQGALADIQPAVETGLIEVDEAFRVRFRHPLLRSAVRQAAEVAQRAQAHEALAGAVREPDRKVWHRASATLAVDSALAAELDRVAARARQRGALAIAAAAWERAAQLAEPGPHRAGWLVAAAAAAAEQGDPVTLQRLLHSVNEQEMRAIDRTQLAWLRETYLSSGWTGASRLGASIEIAERMRRDGDTGMALDMLSAISMRSTWSNPDAGIRREFIATAERMEVSPLDPRLVSILAMVDPVERGAVALERMGQLVTRLGINPAHLFLLGTGAANVGAMNLSASFLADAVIGLCGRAAWAS